MKTQTSKPTVTKKFPIEVPTHTYGSPAAVFKVFFGRKYLIWKGKSLLQSCQGLAETIERAVRLDSALEETHQMYHVVNHMKKSKCTRAKVDVIGTDFPRSEDSDAINGYEILKTEQDALDAAANDPLCLNNNEQAYVPAWIAQKDAEKFLTYFEKSRK